MLGKLRNSSAGLYDARLNTTSFLFRASMVGVFVASHISGVNADQDLQHYNNDEVRRAYAQNTQVIFQSPEEYPKADLYRSEIYRLLAWTDKEQRWDFTERDWEILESAPDHDDAAFVVPEITHKKTLCREAFEIVWGGNETLERSVALAKLMQAADSADRQRLKNHYENLLASLSENARDEIISRAQFPLPVISVPLMVTDYVGVAETIPKYYMRKVFGDCLNVVNLSLFDVARSRPISSKVPDYTQPPAPKGSFVKRFSTPGAVYDGTQLHFSTVLSTTLEHKLLNVVMTPLLNNRWQVDSVDETQRLTAVENTYVHPNPGNGLGQILLQGTLKLDKSRCEVISDITVDYHEDTRALYMDFFKGSQGEIDDNSDCENAPTTYSYQVAFPSYGFDAGWYQVVINDDEVIPLLIQNDDVLPEHTNATVISPYTDLSQLRLNADIKIPTVMMPDLAGAYQGAEFRAHSDTEWELVKLSEPDVLSGIERVEVLKTASRPVQALVRVQGKDQSGCSSSVRAISHFHAEAKTIEVNFFKANGMSRSCEDMRQTFDFVYPVSLLGSEEGEYQIHVNNEQQVSFEIVGDEAEMNIVVTGDFIPRAN